MVIGAGVQSVAGPAATVTFDFGAGTNDGIGAAVVVRPPTT